MKNLIDIQVQMSWATAIDYAFKSGMIVSILLALVALAIAALIFTKGEKLLKDFRMLAAAPFIILAAVFIYQKPGNIRIDNQKTLSNETAEYYARQDPNFNTLFDSLWKENRLIAAPNPDFKK